MVMNNKLLLVLLEYRTTHPADKCPRWTTVGEKMTVSYQIFCPMTSANSWSVLHNQQWYFVKILFFLW